MSENRERQALYRRRPTRLWALQLAERYLAGEQEVAAFFTQVDNAFEYYRQPDLRYRRSMVRDFLGTSWGRALRVHRGVATEEELRDLVNEWVPYLRGSIREADNADES